MSDHDLQISQTSDQSQIDDSDQHKYVVFQIGEELYGTHLLSVREVVEELPIKPLPNTIQAFRGVCNLRGQIVGVLDLAKLFNIQRAPTGRPLLMVFDAINGSLAATVDCIKEVSVILPSDVDDASGVVTGADRRFIKGIGKLRQRLVTLIDLKAALSQQQLYEITSSKLMIKEEAG
jgi:purine-binding chemotaxis protein CheW